MQFFKDIPQEWIAIAGVIIILREIFAFLRAREIKKVQETDTELVHALERISANLETNTDLLKGFVSEMKGLRRDVDGLSKEMDDLRHEIRRRPLTIQN